MTQVRSINVENNETALSNTKLTEIPLVVLPDPHTAITIVRNLILAEQNDSLVTPLHGGLETHVLIPGVLDLENDATAMTVVEEGLDDEAIPDMVRCKLQTELPTASFQATTVR